MQSDDAREEAIEQACIVMHDAYEAAAVREGWETRHASRKPWADVPGANKATMRAAVRALADAGLLRTEAAPVDDETARLHAYIEDQHERLRRCAEQMEDAEAERDELRRQVEAVASLARIQAISCRAQHRADHERNWLDVLAILDGVLDGSQSSHRRGFGTVSDLRAALDGAEGGAAK